MENITEEPIVKPLRRGRPRKADIEATRKEHKFEYPQLPITFTGTPHTLEETVEFFKDDPTMPKTKQGMLALERRIMAKLKSEMKKRGYDFSDFIDLLKDRQCATKVNLNKD